MLSQPDPLLLELFDALQRELACALEAQDKLPEAISAREQNIGRATVLRKIAGLRMLLAELQVALDGRHPRLVH